MLTKSALIQAIKGRAPPSQAALCAIERAGAERLTEGEVRERRRPDGEPHP